MVDLQGFKSNFDLTFSDAILHIGEDDNHVTVETLPGAIVEVVSHLKSKKGSSFNTLIDITAIDYPAREKRFDIIYHLLSMTENMRCRVSTSLSDGEKFEYNNGFRMC